MIGAEREDRQYRRGVVLGLTMAEILLLLLFLLLLVAAARISDVRRALVIVENARDELVTDLAEARARIKEFEKVAGVDVIDVMKKYEAAKARNEELVRQLAQLDQAAALADSARKLWPEAPDPLLRAERALSEIKSNESKVVAARLASSSDEADTLVSRATDAAIASGGIPSTEDLSKKVAQCATDHRDLGNAIGQVEALKRQCAAGGKGMVFPPCWADEKGGAQYIFDAHLTENGIVLKDNKVPGRESDESGLPIAGVRFDMPLGAPEFLRVTTDLLHLSERNKCRHYVRAFDDTGPASKRLFQDLLRAVEGPFYKRPMYNER